MVKSQGKLLITLTPKYKTIRTEFIKYIHDSLDIAKIDKAYPKPKDILQKKSTKIKKGLVVSHI